MPGGMFQRHINMLPVARIVYKYHKRYRCAAKNIEGIKALVHCIKIRQISDSDTDSKKSGACDRFKGVTPGNSAARKANWSALSIRLHIKNTYICSNCETRVCELKTVG